MTRSPLSTPSPPAVTTPKKTGSSAKTAPGEQLETEEMKETIAPVVLVSRFKADLARAMELRGNQLLERDDLEQIIPGLEPLEVFFIIKELGVDEAAAILQSASPEQVQAFVDLDCWAQDNLAPDELDAWLAPFAASGPQELAETFYALDEEVQIMFLSDFIRVYPLPRDDEDNPEGPLDLPDPAPGFIRRTSPDTFFVVDLRVDDHREVHPQFLVEALYSVSVSRAFGLMMALRWEMMSQIEERGYEIRSGRVEELGFPPVERALRIFSKPPLTPAPLPLPKAVRTTTLPAIYAVPLDKDCLLTRALAFVREDIPLSVLEDDLRNLINSALVAYGGGPGDLRKAHHTAEHVRDTVSLGLELILDIDHAPKTASGEPVILRAGDLHGPATRAQAAAAILGQWSMFNVFRRGIWTVLQLQSTARATLDSERFSRWCDTPESQLEDYGDDRLDWQFIDSLNKKPPRLAGFDPIQPTRERAFRSQQDLDEAAARIDLLVSRFVR